jgi:hypothetical protein
LLTVFSLQLCLLQSAPISASSWPHDHTFLRVFRFLFFCFCRLRFFDRLDGFAFCRS